MKKGISPVIGAVILISIMIVFAMGYFLWARGSSFGLFGGEEGEVSCRNIVFNVGDLCFDSGNSKISFSATNNVETDFIGFSLFVEYEAGSVSVLVSDGLDGFGAGQFVSESFSYAGDIKRVSVRPMVQTDSGEQICKEQETIVTDVPDC